MCIRDSISIGLHPEVRHELEERQRQEQELFMQQETPIRQEYIQGSIGAAVDLSLIHI